MEKEENYLAAMPGTFPGLDYTLDHHHQQHPVKHQFAETSSDINGNQVVDYMQPISSGFCGSTSQPSFAEVTHIAEFRPKSAPNQTKTSDEETSGIDPVYFLKFPVLNEKSKDRFLGDHNVEKSPVTEAKTKRKRSRSRKTSGEVESQRMTHIAVERNRRKQMNEHLRVITSLMPGSYAQRGDQASIVGGAIEFVRELEQLLQCLESQKRRRLYGDDPTPIQDSSMTTVTSRARNPILASTIGIVDMTATQQPQPPFLPSMPLPNDDDQMNLVDYENGVVLQEETAESRSILADVEVKLLGFDAMIKILSRRRPGQLIQIIAALEDMQLHIFHTNVTTIEQTVLYSFNVKVAGEARFMAEDIANSVQLIFSFIDNNVTLNDI